MRLIRVCAGAGFDCLNTLITNTSAVGISCRFFAPRLLSAQIRGEQTKGPSCFLPFARCASLTPAGLLLATKGLLLAALLGPPLHRLCFTLGNWCF